MPFITIRCGERTTHMPELSIHSEDMSREHEWGDCWCDPVIERFNKTTNRWEEV